MARASKRMVLLALLILLPTLAFAQGDRPRFGESFGGKAIKSHADPVPVVEQKTEAAVLSEGGNLSYGVRTAAPQIRDTINFLTAWGHGKASSGGVRFDAINVTVDGKEHTASNARPLLPAYGLATVRSKETGQVVAVLVRRMKIRLTGGVVHEGQARLEMQAKGDRYQVTKVTF
jgi:hypothetical protein